MDIATIPTTIPEAPPRPRLTFRGVVWGILGFAAKVVVLLCLPFVVLLRAATYLYQHQGMPTWLALGGGALLALLVLTVYGVWVSKKLTGKGRVRFVAKWMALPLVLFYCGYALLFLATVNAKSDEVRHYYTQVHPLLRVAVSTLILVDEGVVITDLGRTPQDYVAMGLPIYEASLHYVQDDGYVHAMDLRSLDRSGVRNLLTKAYFRLMGFRTLRHVGTADHLHVSLPPH